ncbi:thiolase family protein [Emcibacter sp.]|uniref:thiolase family protein n=1 Tax=Emcibacter sp. TaxID=1979954 RepID=UPI003A93232E
MTTNKQKQPASYDGVALVAPVTVPYERFSEYGAQWFFGRALAELVKSADIEKKDIDGLAVSSFTLAPDSVITLTQYFSLTPRWIEQIPLGGASGVVALRRAARAIQAGDAEVIACIGADTNKKEGFRELVENFSSFSASSSYPYGAAGPNGAFALITQHYMDRFEVKREDFAPIAMAQRHNARAYKHALIKKPMSREDYLDARPIAGPLHMLDCVMPCAGAEAFLVMSIDRARSLGQPYVVIRAADELHNAYTDEDAIQVRAGWDSFAPGMYERAGLGPKDMNLLYTYDDYPVISMMQMEDLGFCTKGKAAEFVQNTPLTFDGGGLVHNSSGGQLSCGQAGSAAGYIGVVEAMRQLTGAALGQQVADAQRALVSGYGMINYDRGLCATAAILETGDKK